MKAEIEAEELASRAETFRRLQLRLEKKEQKEADTMKKLQEKFAKDDAIDDLWTTAARSQDDDELGKLKPPARKPGQTRVKPFLSHKNQPLKWQPLVEDPRDVFFSEEARNVQIAPRLKPPSLTARLNIDENRKYYTTESEVVRLGAWVSSRTCERGVSLWA